ncbi:MAG TPA: precorrin-6y C5,15-methyltransferase (decarboxylating) subunit CbiE [Leucothrix mucor]|nr:precorrin-6y C5,15-methyltransferase (decarboxylating) subunit CbiE [Leucothrix mucor]
MIHVVGLGLGDIETLSSEALEAIQCSSLVMGSQRQLSCIKALLNGQQQRQNYPSPFANLSDDLEKIINKNVSDDICLLASGDPLFYGLGDFLLRHFPVHQLTFHSNTSSVQLAFARIKKPWQQAQVISLHGRPLNNMIPHLRNNRLYAFLTDKQSQPQAIAELLCSYGCENADIWVCEALGTQDEKVSCFKAEALVDNLSDFHPLHVTIVETKTTKCTLPSFPGFDDELFFTDTGEVAKGMITKKEVRLSVLSFLQPQADDIAWDIGAGCGTVAVEWAYWNQQGRIYAVEYHEKRLACLEKNKQKFGVNNLHIIMDKAPECLVDLPKPNTIFIGGTAGKLVKIMDFCWEVLASGGRLVINCVTENCKAELQQWLMKQEINDETVEWTEIAVSKGGQLAGQLLMRPRLPVRLLKIIKE